MPGDQRGIKVPEGSKFGAVTLYRSGSPEMAVAIAEGRLVVFGSPPISLDAQWQSWLGTLETEKYLRGGITSLVTQQAIHPSLLDDQNHELARLAQELMLGMILQGAPSSEGGLVLSGVQRSDALEIRQIQRLRPLRLMQGVQASRLEAADFSEALQIAERLRSDLRSSSDSHRRVRVGLNMLFDALQDAFIERRLHTFVQALDAVLALEKGKARRQFVHRGQLLIGGSEDNANLLGEIYDFRSSDEHLTRVEDLLLPYPVAAHDSVGCLRAFQAEVLTLETYRRVFGRPELFSALQDSSVAEFWRLSIRRQRSLWGAPIELSRLVSERFLDVASGGGRPLNFYPPRGN
ncbi:MAG: hypothetical protein C5B58_00700 [Acidobacteria bacterium]|nr:MAG: hypothetical protein C5B58_00700 [Acidobacteriota bacterium]